MKKLALACLSLLAAFRGPSAWSAEGDKAASFNTNAVIVYYDSSGNATLDPAEPQNASSYSHETLLAIYDTMKFIRPDVSTFCFGQAASAAAVLLAGFTACSKAPEAEKKAAVTET